MLEVNYQVIEIVAESKSDVLRFGGPGRIIPIHKSACSIYLLDSEYAGHSPFFPHGLPRCRVKSIEYQLTISGVDPSRFIKERFMHHFKRPFRVAGDGPLIVRDNTALFKAFNAGDIIEDFPRGWDPLQPIVQFID